jgi:hypothetical protein
MLTARRALALSAIVTVALTSCGSSRPAATSSESHSAIVVLRELAACFRTHGLPTFPDPVMSRDGIPQFPDSAPRTPSSAQQACRATAARLPTSYATALPAPSAAKYRQLLRFASCVRAHGFPAWPDPNAHGQFILPPSIPGSAKLLLESAVRTCDHLNRTQ